jgi:hypothetical protein
MTEPSTDAVGVESVKTDGGKIRCDACPVMCYIADGKSGACDRYANSEGKLIRIDVHRVLYKADPAIAAEQTDQSEADTDGTDGESPDKEQVFVTAIGAGTTYPDYKPAPFIVSQEVDGVDMVTVVTEGIYSYCGVKIKIDTDRHLGPEQSPVRAKGEVVGHVTTGEYGSQMLSLGGVNHLTGGSKKEGKITCDTMLNLCNREAVVLTIDDGAAVVVQAGKAPIVDGVQEQKMRVGCGSATIGMFASQWQGLVDEVVVVDDHITGVVSEHQAGKVIGWQPTGIKVLGRKSTPGRYFQVAEPGTGWGGTDISEPLTILGDFNKKVAKPGQTMLMVSTTGEQYAYFELDDDLKPVEKPLPAALTQSVERIAENCEPARCTVLFMGGAGGSLRAGVTENPVQLTRSVKQKITRVTCGGAPVYVWPGGGITLMVDVEAMPEKSFGYVPTPALVAPVEFTMRLSDYIALGGHADHVLSVDDVLQGQVGRQNDHVLGGTDKIASARANPWPIDAQHFDWAGQ